MRHQSQADQTARNIENDLGKNQGLSAIHDELARLRRNDSKGGKLDHAQYLHDVELVTEKLHKDGILPRVDIVIGKDGTDKLVGVTGDGNLDGKGKLVTEGGGRKFDYNHKTGELTGFTDKDGTSWKLDPKTNSWQQFDQNGNKTGQPTSDLFGVDQQGNLTRTKADGTSTQYNRTGSVFERNAQGNVTQETRANGEVRALQYDSSGKHLKSLQYFDNQAAMDANQPSSSYTKSADGKFYKADDPQHHNPFMITQDKNAFLKIKDLKNGTSTEQRGFGTVVHRDAHDRVTEIDYNNGSKAHDFKYVHGHLHNFQITKKDGSTTSVTDAHGNVTVDDGNGHKQTFKGDLSTDAAGRIIVHNTDHHQTITYGLNGSRVTNGPHGVTDVVNSSGKETTFNYHNNELSGFTAPDGHTYAHGADGKWRMDGQVTNATPSVDNRGNIIITKPDGSYTEYKTDGHVENGISEPKVDDLGAQAAGGAGDKTGAGTPTAAGGNGRYTQAQLNSLFDRTTPNGHGNTDLTRLRNGLVYFRSGMSIDTDGSAPANGDANHQNDTSLHLHGQPLNADKTPFFVLPLGRYQSLGVHPGDIAAVRYHGKVAFAIFGDAGPSNHLGEGSRGLARYLGVLAPGNNSNAENSGVEYLVFPGHADNSGDWNTIQQRGARLLAQYG